MSRRAVVDRFSGGFRVGAFSRLGDVAPQLTELMAISRKAYPWREIEMADKLTGIKESGRFREIPNTTKLQIIEVTRT